MNIKIIGLILLLFASLMSSAQYSEWKEFGLKGQVQSVTSRNYSGSTYDSTSLRILDSTQFDIKSVRFFTEVGMVEWYFCTYGYLTNTNPTRYTIYASYEFDSTNTKISAGAHTKKMRRDTLLSTTSERHTFQWITPYNYQELTYDSTGTKLIRTTDYQLDSSFFLIRETQHHPSKGAISAYTVSVDYTKNNNNQISSCIQTYSDLAESATLLYDYKSYDSRGNPTCYLVHTIENNNTVNTFMVVVEYTYFNQED
jgi:hypothetical protein